MINDEFRKGMESEGISPSWTERYIEVLEFVRAQRNAAIAAAEGHDHVVLPEAPSYVTGHDIEMGNRLLALLKETA